MATLNYHANNVLGEFGFLPPEHLLAFEDVKREFVRVRSLEMQKLGLSSNHKTLTKAVLDLSAESRDALVPSEMMPAFVEIHPTDSAYTNHQEKIEIVPLEELASYEGSKVIAFYGTPMRYRLGFDAWNYGSVTLFYDAIDDYTAFDGTDTIVFPPNFYIYLECKTALALIALFRLKIAFLFPPEQKEQMNLFMNALSLFEQSKFGYVNEWQIEFKKWKNKELNEQPHLRRTQTELWRNNFHNVTGFNPLGTLPPSLGSAQDEDIVVTVDGGTP